MTHRHPTDLTPRRHWLCVAYAFPPINRSGTHRTLGFVKHLDRLGWDATVVTVEPGDEPRDDFLLTQVPPSTEVIRTPWIDWIARLKQTCPVGPRGRRESGAAGARRGVLPDEAVTPRASRGLSEWISRLLITPDSRVGWVGPAFHQGMAAIRRHPPEVIYSTSPYMTAHLIALRLHRRTKIPWVADFRDPWRDNPFRDLGFPSLERWDAWLERLVLRSATHLICNTSTMLERWRKRLPFVAGKATVITNGFDRELFDNLAPIRIAPADHFVLTHCGQFYGPRSPQVWFDALRLVSERSPELAGKMHLALLGPDHFEGHPLADLAAAAGVGNQVRVLGTKSHRDTLSHMAGSDALMLAGSTGPGSELQVPNKLFEYLAVRKPIIATAPSNSPVMDLLDQAHAEAIVCAPGDTSALADAITRVANGDYPEVADPWSGVARFERAHRAEELREIFEGLQPRDALVTNRGSGRGSWPAHARWWSRGRGRTEPGFRPATSSGFGEG